MVQTSSKIFSTPNLHVDRITDARYTPIVRQSEYEITGRVNVGRRKKFDESLVVRLLAGTKKRIEKALTATEDMADLIREAIERELQRRERRS